MSELTILQHALLTAVKLNETEVCFFFNLRIM